MRRLPLYKLCVFFIFTLAIIVFYHLIYASAPSETDYEKLSVTTAISLSPSFLNTTVRSMKKLVLSFVVCESRFNESLTVVKSALIFTKSHLHFVIFADDTLKPEFEKVLSQWRILSSGQLDFELHSIQFPVAHREVWMNLFKKCAAQRLFIPELITEIDSLIYVDTDTLFLGPIDELWDYFFKFSTTQISALALEVNAPDLSWYHKYARHPYYGIVGVNSGVMLMNLTRMRDFGWGEYITPIMLKWRQYIPWGDQDIINIIFHYHQSRVFELSCRYNFRTEQCMYGDHCPDAMKRGVFLLHGSRSVFHNHQQPAFEAIYRAIAEYEVGTEPRTVLPRLETYLTEATKSAKPNACASLKDAALKVPIEVLARKNYAEPGR